MPVWSSHFDEDTGEVYFYNRLTDESLWEKPADFDGYEIMKGLKAKKANSIYQRTFGGASYSTPLEVAQDTAKGEIGAWEEVRTEKQVLPRAQRTPEG